MLSYKYYQSNKNIEKISENISKNISKNISEKKSHVPSLLIKINNMFKESFSTELKTNLTEFKNPINSNDRRFNI